MSFLVPNSFSLAYSKEQIADKVQSMGREISHWAKEVDTQTGKPLLVICVLRGGVIFFADLIRAIDTSVEPAFCRTWSYSSENNTQLHTATNIRVDISEVAPQQRSILIVDDICDSGSTLIALRDAFLELKVNTIKTAVLVYRKVPAPMLIPTWAAFKHSGDDWFAGYGMEDKNRYANLQDLYIS